MPKENKDISPEQKAKELVEKLFVAISITTGGKLQGSFKQGMEIRSWAAKECGTILCDEILSVLEKADEDRGRNEQFRPLEEYDYWSQVKQHIKDP
jgi:hypothetical protein